MIRHINPNATLRYSGVFERCTSSMAAYEGLVCAEAQTFMEDFTGLLGVERRKVASDFLLLIK